MNVANLELCRELYELSGWGEDWQDRPEHAWYSFEGKRTGSYWEAVYDEHNNRDPFDNRRPTGITHRIERIAHAYDLGYLLRKLPNRHSVGRTFDRPYWFAEVGAVDTRADNPEDAACKLAIELFKQGVLKKEENHGTNPKT